VVNASRAVVPAADGRGLALGTPRRERERERHGVGPVDVRNVVVGFHGRPPKGLSVRRHGSRRGGRRRRLRQRSKAPAASGQGGSAENPCEDGRCTQRQTPSCGASWTVARLPGLRRPWQRASKATKTSLPGGVDVAAGIPAVPNPHPARTRGAGTAGAWPKRRRRLIETLALGERARQVVGTFPNDVAAWRSRQLRRLRGGVIVERVVAGRDALILMPTGQY
jgi:hypothetical protein